MIFALAATVLSVPQILVNQVGFELNGPKSCVIRTDTKLGEHQAFALIDSASSKVVFRGTLHDPQKVAEWFPTATFYSADFSRFQRAGSFRVSATINGQDILSPTFEIGHEELARKTIPSIVSYYRNQRADTLQELGADKHLILFGSTNTVDMHGGWCDASGDVSKYFSHLAYANFMSPQQTPLVVWSLANSRDTIPDLLTDLKTKREMEEEALWGADYMMRALSKDDYFYMIVFSYFNKDPNARRVVGLHADSMTTDEYQAAFREGGGMAIAALAKVARWKKNGNFTSAQYLAGAKRAFAHLLVNNTKYDDDGKENIIDDYCALMAATELWVSTDETLYRDQARKRAMNLIHRMTKRGYFISDNGSRPFWHASDAGLPIVALCRYLDKETDPAFRKQALATIKSGLDYNLSVAHEVPNPFGYARQTFRYKNALKDGFFIPHDNETGWWWQGEDARLGSLATAAILGGRLVYADAHAPFGIRRDLGVFAERQLSWILGSNPFSICLMYKFGETNVPYMHSNFGHGSQKGGISNGITGREGNGDGTGIDFKTEDQGNEWRWTEQWLPHAAWFLQAVTAMSDGKRS